MKKYLKHGLALSISGVIIVLAIFVLKLGFNIPPTYNSATAINSLSTTKTTINPFDSFLQGISSLSSKLDSLINVKSSTIQKIDPKTEISFDAEPPLFDKTEAGQIYLKNNQGHLPIIHDAWNYPEPTTIFEKENTTILKSITSYNYGDVDSSSVNGSVLNCRTSTSIHGYFKAYFEDVALANGLGYNDATHGQARRDEVCHVLVDIAHMLKLDTVTTSPNVAPDIVFAKDPGSLPVNALAAASAFFGFDTIGPDNGALHKHIITKQDPTPANGSFDAIVFTKFGGSASWDIDSTLNSGTYSFYTVIYHEMMHALGFRGLLPAVISLTNVPIQHGTFDENSYGSNTATTTNRFLKQGTGYIFYNLLQVPIGNPSSWFTNTAVSYRGTKNIIGASPDGVHPIFSPTSWQQGSSLSHFYNSTIVPVINQYIMNPAISAGIATTIQNDEKEVLCHLGYQVNSMTGTNSAGCAIATPVAVDDGVIISNTSGVPTATCVDVLYNDIASSGGTLHIDSLQKATVQSTDTITYYSGMGCSGSTSTTASGAQSLKFFPTTNTSQRFLYYTVRDSVSNRISFPAKITLSVFTCSNDPTQYVCNGDFELGSISNLPSGGSSNSFLGCQPYGTFNPSYQVPFWCGNSTLTPDFAGKNLPYLGTSHGPFNVPFQNSATGYLDMVDSGSYEAVPIKYSSTPAGEEKIVTRLKTPLLTGGHQYVLSFDLELVNNSFGNSTELFKADLSPNYTFTNYNFTSSQNIYSQSFTASEAGAWQHITTTAFTPTQTGMQYLSLGVSSTASGNSGVTQFIDNVSLKEVSSGTNSISGIVYNDLNNNGIQDGAELGINGSGLSGITIGLFNSTTSTTPVQTVVTSSIIPNIGKYIFQAVANGTYYIAVIPETGYASITQPTINNLLVGHHYTYSVPVSSGQNVVGKNFGVVLNSALPPGCFFVNGVNGLISCI